MPAEAMKKFIEKHVQKKSGEAPQELTLGDCLKQEKFFHMFPCPEKWTKLTVCYEKVGRKVDGIDKDGHTALYYAITIGDSLALCELLKLGADINKVMPEKKKTTLFSVFKFNKDSIAKKEAEAFDLLERVFLTWHDSYEDLVPCLLDYSFMQRLASFSKDRAIERSRFFLRYPGTIKNTLLNADCGIIIDQEIMNQAHDQGPYRNSQPLFECILCSCDIKNIQRFIPVLVSNKELRECFEIELEKFKCQEYKEEIGRMLVAQKNKNVMSGMLKNKKLVDAQWRFV